MNAVQIVLKASVPVATPRTASEVVTAEDFYDGRTAVLIATTERA